MCFIGLRYKQSEKAVDAFYTHYFDYQKNLGSERLKPGPAWTKEVAAVAPYLTSDFIKKRKALYEKCSSSPNEIPDGCGYDVFYCGQEAPTSFVVIPNDSKQKKQSKHAKVSVEFCFGCTPDIAVDRQSKHKVMVSVSKTKGKWLISRVDCH